MTELNKKDLFDTINYGTAWHTERIKAELEKIIASRSKNALELNWDADDKFYYLYNNECYLFVENGVVSVRSDKDNVASTDKTFKHPINSIDDIKAAYAKFNSVTMEGEDE